MTLTNIIPRIFQIRTGKPFSLDASSDLQAFLDELLTFHRLLEEEGGASVSPVAIKNWLIPKGQPPKISQPKRKDASEFLHQYLAWVSGQNTVTDKDRKSQLVDLTAYLKSTLQLKPDPSFNVNVPFDEAQDLYLSDATVLSAVHAIVYASSKNQRSERDDLFRGGKAEGDDQSYYLLYRFSTNKGELIKSFIRLNTPSERSNTFSFNHFVWCGRNVREQGAAAQGSHIFRECEGVIAKFDTSYYFIGYNFTVPLNRLTNPERYNVLRKKRRERPAGIGLLSFEYDSFRQNPGLVSGLTMTLAANDQPIISRVAFLHLGTESALGIKITDDLVIPGEVKIDDLASDLEHLIQKLRKAGCSEFSEYVETITNATDWGSAGSLRLAQDIVGLCENVPAWEKVNRTQRAMRGHGAIETIGLPSRPRD